MNEVLNQVKQLANTIVLEEVVIPSYLQSIDITKAIHLRLAANVSAIGGYTALAASIGIHSPNKWEKIISNEDIRTNDFIALIKHFDDKVLPALMCLHSGGVMLDCSDIPASEYCLNDLIWTLKRYFAKTTELSCDLREAKLDGTSYATLIESGQNLCKEIFILSHQISLSLQEEITLPKKNIAKLLQLTHNLMGTLGKLFYKKSESAFLLENIVNHANTLLEDGFVEERLGLALQR